MGDPKKKASTVNEERDECGYMNVLYYVFFRRRGWHTVREFVGSTHILLDCGERVRLGDEEGEDTVAFITSPHTQRPRRVPPSLCARCRGILEAGKRDGVLR